MKTPTSPLPLARPTPRGFTMLEMLIAMTIFASVIGLAYGAIIRSVREQAVQEASTNTQAKLRRIIEVMTQDIRSAVLGGITNSPYPSGESAISFAMLTGGAGFPLSGSSATGTTITALNSNAFGLANGDLLFLLDTVQNRGILRNISSAPTLVGGNQYTITYANCPNAASTALAFEVASQGYRYDSTNKRLLFRENSGTEQIAAFNITSFTIQYVYRVFNGTTEQINPSGYASGGSVLQTLTISGSPYYLQRVSITLASSERANGRDISRTYTGQIELLDTTQQLSANNQPFIGVVPCS